MTDQLPEPLDVIAVGAHPDDVEIGCGGTLAKLVAQGFRVGIVDITDGEPTPRSSGPEERLAEATKAASVLGVVHREQLGFPNRKLFDCFEVRVALAKFFRRHRPRLVLGIGDKTPMASPDHAQALAITEAAVFYSRLTKWMMSSITCLCIPSPIFWPIFCLLELPIFQPAIGLSSLISRVT